MIKIICFVILVSAFSAAAEAAELGRITGQVYFREGPSRSAPVIEVLAAGTKVEILKRLPSGWYMILYRGRRGFIQENYIWLQQQHQNAAKHFDSLRSQFVTLAGIVLLAIGVSSMLSIVAPFLFKVGIVLVGCALWVLMLDLAFNLGALYSLISVTLGVLIVLLFLARKKKNQTISAGENALAMKKAA